MVSSILFAPDGRGGPEITGTYGLLDEWMRRNGIEVLVVDGISDVFGGNENSRGEVKRFVNLLLALIPPATGAVIMIGKALLGHRAPGAANRLLIPEFKGSHAARVA